jgi:hypothetical protein
LALSFRPIAPNRLHSAVHYDPRFIAPVNAEAQQRERPGLDHLRRGFNCIFRTFFRWAPSQKLAQLKGFCPLTSARGLWCQLQSF